MVLKIAIIGGGVVGFSCGVRIAEYFRPEKAEITLISEKFTPETTGDGSAGLWGPYLCGETNPHKIREWSKDTHDFLQELWTSSEAGDVGICLVPQIRISPQENETDNLWSSVVFGYEDLSKDELKRYSEKCGKDYKSGIKYLTFTSEPIRLIPYLMRRFNRAGGMIKKSRISNLYEFAKGTDYDIVINCTGLGAREIVPDEKVYPIRGQVVRVKANWMFNIFLDNSDGNYIIPNCDSIILGGTHQENDYNLTPDPKDKEFILNGCQNICPGLKNAEILKDWVGLRPGRTSVRLEKEILSNGKLIIHNYGHGGCGVTLAWGCAKEVLDLINSGRSKL